MRLSFLGESWAFDWLILNPVPGLLVFRFSGLFIIFGFIGIFKGFTLDSIGAWNSISVSLTVSRAWAFACSISLLIASAFSSGSTFGGSLCFMFENKATLSVTDPTFARFSIVLISSFVLE